MDIPKREEKVDIYCRVSTNSAEQLQSLTAQVSHLTKLTAAMPNGFWQMFIWILQQVKLAHHAKSENVKLIFNLYLGGQSILGIIKELEKRKTTSPTGNAK